MKKELRPRYGSDIEREVLAAVLLSDETAGRIVRAVKQALARPYTLELHDVYNLIVDAAQEYAAARSWLDMRKNVDKPATGISDNGEDYSEFADGAAPVPDWLRMQRGEKTNYPMYMLYRVIREFREGVIDRRFIPWADGYAKSADDVDDGDAVLFMEICQAVGVDAGKVRQQCGSTAERAKRKPEEWWQEHLSIFVHSRDEPEG